jgi:hypothetical protein
MAARKIEFALHPDGRFRVAQFGDRFVAIGHGRTYLATPSHSQRTLRDPALVWGGVMSANMQREAYTWFQNETEKAQVKTRIARWKP